MDSSVMVSRFDLHGARRCPGTRVHDFSVLALVTSGSGVMQQRERWSLQTGDVLLVPSGAAHCTPEAEHVSMWGLRLMPASLCAEGQAHLLSPFERVRAGGAAVVRLPEARRAFMSSLFGELERELHEAPGSREGDTRARDSLLTLVMSEVARAAALTPARPARADLVSECLRYIEQHCLEPLTLERVAMAVQRSPAYLTTQVKAATGRSVVQWIIAGRMAEARRRLTGSDERIDVIAERVGYADATHFGRLFRREHAVSPGAYRASALASSRGDTVSS